MILFTKKEILDLLESKLCCYLPNKMIKLKDLTKTDLKEVCFYEHNFDIMLNFIFELKERFIKENSPKKQIIELIENEKESLLNSDSNYHKRKMCDYLIQKINSLKID